MNYEALRDGYLHHVESCGQCDRNPFGCDQKTGRVKILAHWTISRCCSIAQEMRDQIGRMGR